MLSYAKIMLYHIFRNNFIKFFLIEIKEVGEILT